jgi:uroporphyrin-3 C-methyltransferase
MSTEIESLTTDMNARRNGGGVSPMWFAFATLALLLAVYAHWRFGQFDDRIDRLRAQTLELRAAQDRLASQVVALGSQIEQSNQQFRAQIGSLREVPTQVGELGASVAELRARTEAPQRTWVRAEALYLLELANRRLRLDHDVTTAIAAMESADARLAAVEDPSIATVRAQLAQELAALRAVDVPDLPGIVARLAAIERRVPEFGVLGVPVANARRTSATRDTATSSFDRATQRLAQAWRDLFSFRRVDPATTRLVTSEEETLRRQHLELLLFAARIGAMQQDPAAYRQSLESAIQWLDRYFKVKDAGVIEAREELQSLAALVVKPVRPETGKAAQMLQRVVRADAPPQ